MKLAIVGSRNLIVCNLGDYIPAGVTEILTGGARGIDTCARDYARQNGIRITEFFPDYRRFGRGAPLRRNRELIAEADEVLAIWDGVSSGTASSIHTAEKAGKKVTVVLLSPASAPASDPPSAPEPATESVP